MAWVVLILAPVTANNLIDIDELLEVDPDSQSADVGCNGPVHVKVVCDGCTCQEEDRSFVIVKILCFDV